MGVILYWFLSALSPFCQMGFLLFFFFFGVFISNEAEKIYGHDSRKIVIDEVAGCWVSILFLPQKTFWIITGFLLFRLLDIVKPFPARWAEKLNKGWGVMTDDLIAGLYTNIILQVTRLILWKQHLSLSAMKFF